MQQTGSTGQIAWRQSHREANRQRPHLSRASARASGTQRTIGPRRHASRNFIPVRGKTGLTLSRRRTPLPFRLRRWLPWTR